jgi:cobalt/nickel transport system permease protein
VYLAMVSRGYTGRLPRIEQPRASARQWAVSALLPVAAAGIALVTVLP